MRSLLSIPLAVLGAGGLALACYAERPAPPTYRFHCADQSDCHETEQCIQSLCETPCTQATSQEDCQTSSTGQICFNGTCASTCAVLDDPCPMPHTCIDFGLKISSGGGFFSSNGSSGPIGLCGSKCSNERPCPGDEQCVLGVCIAPCETAETCLDGLDCILGLCIPPPDDNSSSNSNRGTTGAAEGGSGTSTGDATSSGGAQ